MSPFSTDQVNIAMNEVILTIMSHLTIFDTHRAKSLSLVSVCVLAYPGIHATYPGQVQKQCGSTVVLLVVTQ
jgi:hypothetical protein